MTPPTENVNENREVDEHSSDYEVIRRGADKSLVFPISYFPICSTTKRIFLGWLKEVRNTKSQVCGAQGRICKYIFSIP
jgi:hypothetical protein